MEQETLTGFRNTKSYYTTRELAEIYHVSTATICNWIHKGWLQGEKISDKRDDAKRDTRHWHVWPQQIEDMETRRDELIEASKRYWVKAYIKMRA